MFITDVESDEEETKAGNEEEQDAVYHKNKAAENRTSCAVESSEVCEHYDVHL